MDLILNCLRRCTLPRNRVEMANARGWTVKEIYSAIDAWRQLYRRQPGSTITLDQYLNKMQGASLRPDMIGLHRGKYSLGRVNDEGAYHSYNCRFLRIEENMAERKPQVYSDELKARLSDIAKNRPRFVCPHCGTSAPKSMFTRWHGERCRQLKTA